MKTIRLTIIVFLLALPIPAWATMLIPYTSGGTPICDPVGDISPADSDITCNSTDHASVYFGSDSGMLGFAFVLGVDPRTTTQQTPLLSNAYVVEIFVGGVQVATVGVDGKQTAGTDYVYAKCFGSSTFTYQKLVNTAVADGQASVTPEPGGEGYFRLEFRVPLSALTSCGVAGTTAVQLRYGTSQAANLDVINKDDMGIGDAVKPGDATAVPRLTVAKLDVTDPVVAGDELVFVLSFANTGNADATGVVLTDVVPSGTTFVSATGGGLYDSGSNTVTWSLGTLPVGASGSVALRVAVASSLPSGTVIPNAVIGSTTNNGSSTGTSTTEVTSKAELTIAKIGAPNPVTPGAQLVYTIDVGNVGFSDAAGLILTDPVPAHTTFVAASDGGTYDVVTNTVTWSLGALVSRASRTVTLHVQVETPLPDQTVIDNTVTASATNAATMTASTSTTVSSEVVLNVRKTALPDPAKAGQGLTYTIEFGNTGTADATGVVLTDALPAHTTFVGASGGGVYDPIARVVAWSLGTLAAGATGTMTLELAVDSPLANGTVLENNASLEADNAPFVSARTTTTVTSAPVVTITKDGPAGRVNAGQRITYTITIANTGTDQATGVVLTDPLPGHTTFVSVSSPGVWDQPTNTVSWAIGTLPAGATRTETLTLDIVDPLPEITTIVNAATVTSAEAEPQTAVFVNEVLFVRVTPTKTMDFRFGVKGVVDDIAVAAFNVQVGPGQKVDAVSNEVVIELANDRCGGTFSRVVLPAGSLRGSATAGTQSFAGYVIDGVSGAREYVSVRFVPSGENLVLVTLNYSRANFICLEGTQHESVHYTITAGDLLVETSVFFQRLALGTLYWPPRNSGADLVLTALGAPPAVIARGSRFPVTDTVENQGLVTSRTSRNRYYFSADAVKGPGDVLLTGYRDVPALAPGGGSSGSTTLTVPAAMVPGTYYLIACADDLLVVVEADEVNNCRASGVTVSVSGPDLIASAVGDPPATVNRGARFTGSDTVQNVGTAGAAASYVRYYLSTDTSRDGADIRLTGYRYVGALAVGASSSGTALLTVPLGTVAGSYYVLACADDYVAVKELDETNNCRASTGTVTVGP